VPRLLDTLDAVAGRTPAELDLGIDYLVRTPCPERLISSDGTYNAGWFEEFTGEINFEASSAFKISLHRFFHLTIDTGRYFLVWNIADFNRAGNTAILVVDKQTGEFHQQSKTGLFARNRVSVSSDGRRFFDGANNSFIDVSDPDGRITFSVHAGKLHFSGQAEQALGPPLVQCTRFHRGRGSLQWYGNMRLLHGTLTLGRQVVLLPAGCLGTFDRTAGHQRGLQNWNWIAGVGRARCVQQGCVMDLGLQVHQDLAGAKPRIQSKKHVVWVDAQLFKIPTAKFDYEITDPQTRETGPWRITSDGGRSGDDWFDLTLMPQFQRREHRERVLLNVDFNQYYGELTGAVCVRGRVWELEPMFAVAEDSRLQF
jgi:hypothetical protein